MRAIAWLDVLPTQGALTGLPADALAGVLHEVGTAIDVMGGHFTPRYTNVAVSAVRTAARTARRADRHPGPGRAATARPGRPLSPP